MAKVIDDLGNLILQEAKAIAYEEGLGEISIRKVATHCNIATGTIYNYYPTKIDLVMAVVEDFWAQCFRNIHKELAGQLDFFETLEKIYFYMLEYLEHFKKNLLIELTLLDTKAKSIGKQKEAVYINKFSHMILQLINAHQDEFNMEVVEKIGKAELAEFIFSNYINLLKTQKHNYSSFDFILKKVLS